MEVFIVCLGEAFPDVVFGLGFSESGIVDVHEEGGADVVGPEGVV